MAQSSKANDQTKKNGKASKYDIGEDQLQDITEAFQMCDTKGEGSIETKQIKFAMRALGFEPRKEEIKKIIADIDKENTGKINKEDFIQLMVNRIAEKDANEEIIKAFQLFDENGSGNITFEDLKRVAKELGENIGDEELKEMIDEADLTGDGTVNRDEFLRIMKKTCLY